MEERAFFEEGIVKEGDNLYPRYHLPSVGRMPNGELIAIFVGTEDLFVRDTIMGSISSDGGRTWGEAFTIIDSPDGLDGDPALTTSRDRVIVMDAELRPPFGLENYHETRINARSSDDNGRSWGPVFQLHTDHRYWAMPNKGIELEDGTLLKPFWWEVILEFYQSEVAEREMVTCSGVLASNDGGETWQERGNVFLGDPREKRPSTDQSLDEPSIVELSNGDIYMLMRTKLGRLYETVSHDKGYTWEEPRPTQLISCSAPAALHRLSKEPSKIVAVWNNSPDHRWPLDVAISYDDCKTWAFSRTIADPGEQVAYPAITSTEDGTVVVVYHLKWGRKPGMPYYPESSVNYARFNEKWIRGED